MTELRKIIAEEVAELERQFEETWEGVEQPQLQDWRSGMQIDLGPEGTRLHRYEAAADRLFRSAWTKLERLRKDRDEPLIPHSELRYARHYAARPPAPPAAPPPVPVSPAQAPAPSPVRPESVVPSPSLHDDPPTVLDFWVAGPPRDHSARACPVQDEPDAKPAGDRRTSPRAPQPSVATRVSGWISRSGPFASRQT